MIDLFALSDREIQHRILTHKLRAIRLGRRALSSVRAYNSCMLHAAQQLLLPAVLGRLTLWVNHVLSSESAATARLKPHAGRSICLQLSGWPGALPALPSLVFLVTPAGLLEWQASESNVVADLSLEIEASNPAKEVLRRLAGQAPSIRVSGDAAFAADVSWITDNLRWDVEDDLARVVGQAPAHELARVGRAVAQALRGMVGFALSRSAPRFGSGSDTGGPGPTL